MRNHPKMKKNFLLEDANRELEIETTIFPNAKKIAIICHPHPLYGGSMHNKVVTTVARAFHACEVSTICFNFRGVGKSSGSFAEGIGEKEDLLTIIEWTKRNFPNKNIWLSGFSFGSYVVALVANEYFFELVILIAPPIGRFFFTTLPLQTKNLVIIQGLKDEIVNAQEVIHFAKTVHATLITLPQASHFFHGQLVELKKLLLEYCCPLLD